VTDPLLASGREADVYALDDQRVLRRYRRDADVTGEAAAMRYLAGLGYPIPAVYEATGANLVLERLDGPTMAQALATGSLSIADGAAQLAGLLRRLHELPPWPGAAPGTSILHLDLHPENVLMSARGPVVIDWCNARPGDPDLDTGLSALILARSRSTASTPGPRLPASCWRRSCGRLPASRLGCWTRRSSSGDASSPSPRPNSHSWNPPLS
jgi:aminoglycoside phosphotransferase (APT) family kinase protein